MPEQPTERHPVYCKAVKRRFFRELHAHITLSGGDTDYEKLRRMTVQNLMDMITPNRIELKVISERVDGKEALTQVGVLPEDMS